MLESTDMRLDLDPGSFFDEFHPRVFRFVAGATGAPEADVDDLVQETLLHAWKNRAQFRGEASPLTWVLSIARNRIRMRNRSLGKRAEAEAALRAVERASRSAKLSAPIVSPVARTAALSTAFLISRTLPGQSYSMRIFSACGAIPWILPPWRRLKSAMKASISAGMSSLRSRRGGTTIVTTFRR